MSESSHALTLVLLGESGSGKSASGNTILGEKMFLSRASSIPDTTECEVAQKTIYGTPVTVIDTPDLSDKDLQQLEEHVKKCRNLCQEGVCVYLLVMQIGRFTEGERDILERLEKALGTRIRDRTIILFTRGDDLDQSIDEYVKNTNKYLKTLLKECGDRYHVFNNKMKDEQQVKGLCVNVAGLLKKGDGIKVFPQCQSKCVLCVIA